MRIKNYSIPLLVLLLGIIQISLSKWNHLNNWKLGGYGMYSTYHPNNNSVWVKINQERLQAKKITSLSKNKDYKEQLSICFYYPNTKNLRKLQNIIKEKFDTQNVSVEVWRPNYNVTTKKYNRVLINSYED